MRGMDFSIGVIERGDIPARAVPATVTDTSAFASSLANRYGSRAFVASGADLALAWEAPASVNHYYGSRRVEISPEVKIEENYTFAGPAHDAVVRDVIAPFDEARASALFERLFTRRVRFAPFDSPGDSAPVSTPPQKLLPPMLEQRVSVMERVMPTHHAAERPANAIAPAPAMPSKGDAGWGTPLPARDTAQPLSLAAPEIRRVADQVMREIDHRARAHRERTGRMAR